MPHKCVHCSKMYSDGASEVLNGCSQCGGKFFFYLTEEKLKQMQKEGVETPELNPSDKKQVEEDVREIAGITDMEAPVILDFESVIITKPGKYVLDIPNLFSKERPLVYKLEDGKYVIDLASQANPSKKSKQRKS